MAEKIRFTINKETLLMQETDGFVLTRVPNSKGQNYVAFDKDIVIGENSRTLVVEIEKDAQIAMWKGKPEMTAAESAQTYPDYMDKNMVRLSAGDLYSDYYRYSKDSDPTVNERRKKREQQYDSQNKPAASQDAAQDQDAAQKDKESENVAQSQEGQNQKATSATQNTTQEKKYFDQKQMVEIMKGMILKLDVKQYNNIDLDAAQMRELRLGLQQGVDISQWNSKDIPAEVMKELRRGARRGVGLDMKKNLAWSRYDAAQMRELRLGFEQKLNVKHFLNPAYDAAQMRELRLGLRAGLDIGAYQSPNFSAEQMQWIRHRLVINHIMDILKNFLQEARVWLAERAESVADMLVVKVDKPQVQQIMEEMPKEVSPVENIKDVLIKSDMVDAAVFQNAAVNELLKKKVVDMVNELAALTPDQEMQVESKLEETAVTMAQTAGAELKTNVIQFNYNSPVETSQVTTAASQVDKTEKEVSDPQLDKDSIYHATEEYVEETQVTEEAMVMEA